MDLKLSLLLLVACTTAINGVPINTEADAAESEELSKDKIVLTKDELNAILSPHHRNGLVASASHWPGGIVYYQIDSAFDDSQVAAIKQAFNDIETVTCVRFRERTLFTLNYVYIEDSPIGCRSAVGKIGGKQILNLERSEIGIGCFDKGVMLHQLLHTLGFHHQQSAPDRDDYVTIQWKNIMLDKWSQFIKYPEGVVSEFGEKYDYDSIMHYTAFAFSSNGLETIIPHDRTAKIGRKEKMSDSDIRKINRMYNCPGY